MPAFWIGVVMVGYDATGHALCLIARLCGQSGADVWNAYSRYVFPAVYNSVSYDLYWATWHFTAITLIILGYFTKGTYTP